MARSKAGLCLILWLAAVSPALFMPSAHGSTAKGQALNAKGQALNPDTPHIIFTGSEFYPPLQWLDTNRQPLGFLLELQQAMAATGIFTAEHKLQRWNDALEAVRNGEVQAVALIASEQRQQWYDFTAPIYYVAHAIFTRTNERFYGRIDQLGERRVAVVEGAYAQLELLANGYSVNTVLARDELHCLQLVAQQQADACIEVIATSRHLIADYELDLHQASPPFWPQPYSFGVQKGDSKTLQLLNTALAEIIIDGSYQQVYERWLPYLEWQPKTLVDYLQQFAWLLALLLALALAGLVWLLQLRRQLAFVASHDLFTGLLRRNEFVERVNQRLSRGENGVLVAVRINNLDSVMTAFSYQTSIAMLQSFARRLDNPRVIEKSHFGAGLFALWVNELSDIDEFFHFIATPLAIDVVDIDPSEVMGLAVREPGVDAEELSRRALTALSYAQGHGYHWLEYQQDFEPDPEDLLLLREFARRGNNDFVLHFQPQFNARRRKIDAAEALVRWQHPERGLLGPLRFIGLLEDAGLITQLTRWVIAESVRVLQQQLLGPDLQRLSINVTPHDLLEPGFVSFVRDSVASIDPRQLCFEITETGFFEDSQQARGILDELVAIGIQCSVDDFGTGHASLSYLSLFPVSEVKLDRSFVCDVITNERNRAIVKSSIELAHVLGIEVTAEGVEDVATFELLQRLGCDRIQGFHIAKPGLPADIKPLIG